jgi:protease-4
LALAIFASPALAQNTMVHVKLKGPMPEAPAPMELGMFMGDSAPISMFDLLETLNQARTDPDVRAVLFEIDAAQLGLAQIEELRDQFRRLRAAEKDVWVYGEVLTLRTYALASAASKVVMMPTGELFLEGLYGEAMYFKQMLDHLDVKADIIHIGDFKSAGEPFYREGPSEEAKQQTETLLDGMYKSLCEMIADSRGMTADQVKGLVDKAIHHPDEAQKAGLVDEVMYRQDLRQAIKRQYGHDVNVTRNYGGDDATSIDFNDPFAIFKMFGEIMDPDGGKKSARDTIAIVYVDSAITSGKTEQSPFGGGAQNSGSDTVAMAIDRATAEDNIKALVLRVDSPGGSAIASDVICEAVKRCKDKGKPVIVSMGNVAASGGYYVSCLADTIYAEPTTITGSIGVVGGKIVTKGFWDWVGITSHEYKRGAHSDLFNTNRVFNESERTLVKNLMLDVYGDFKGRVIAGRGDKIQGDLESLAGGRVYTGTRALEIGLVDKLGGLGDAVRAARSAAGIDRFELEVLPRPQTLADMLRTIFGGQEEDDEFDLRAGPSLRMSPKLAPLLPMIRQLDPAKAAAIERMLMQIDMMQREQILMVDASIPLLR